MEPNDPGREPEPTDAELICEMAKVQAVHTLTGNGRPTLLHNQIVKICDRGREYLSGARPMPDSAKNLCVMVGHTVRHWGYCVFEEVDEGEYCKIKGPYETRQLAEAAMREADTPAPDEVAQLPEHFCTYPDCRCKPDELDGWCAKGLPTPISLWRQNTALTARIADLEREVADRNSDYINDSATLAEISAENTAIRAKCSDLERENAALGEKLGALEKWSAVVEDHESFPEGVRAFSRGYESARRWVAMWFNPVVSAGKEAPDADL